MGLTAPRLAASSVGVKLHTGQGGLEPPSHSAPISNYKACTVSTMSAAETHGSLKELQGQVGVSQGEAGSHPAVERRPGETRGERDGSLLISDAPIHHACCFCFSQRWPGVPGSVDCQGLQNFMFSFLGQGPLGYTVG